MSQAQKKASDCSGSIFSFSSAGLQKYFFAPFFEHIETKTNNLLALKNEYVCSWRERTMLKEVDVR